MTDPTSHKRPRVVMVVDDEAVVTQSIGAFLELETNHTVVQFQSPRAAIDHMQVAHVDLVISDFLMPEMNGLEFLAEVKRLSPDVPRIILTGYADKENSIRAINEVGIYQYIEKPWDNDLLKLVVDNALSQKGLREQLSERIHALDTALLERDKLQARDQHLSSELAMAQRLQRSMLPMVLPCSDRLGLTARYVPALEVGGDFYDIMPLANDRVGILVADATGHGIQAALSTAVLKFSFQSFANCECSPCDILKGMNGVLRQGLPEETFVAALVATLDITSRSVRIGNAGIPHPFLARRASGRVERLPAAGFMLGIVEDDVYDNREEVTVELERGDTLWFYTDGLSESASAKGEHFDDSRLARTLTEHCGKPVNEIADVLLAASREHSHSAHAWDDITLFGIEAK